MAYDPTSPGGRNSWIGKWTTAAACVMGALAWGLPFWIRFRGLQGSWWQWRDDAVITLSEAKNVVQFGTIGLSPGTGRVEAFSTPLQFGVAAFAFFIHQMSYEAFLNWYVAICIGVIGALVGLIVFRTALVVGMHPLPGFFVAVLLTLVSAIATVTQYTAAGWLVSGMENPLVVVCGLLIAVCTIDKRLGGANLAGAVTGLSLLGIARVEFVALMLPILCAVAAVFWWSYSGRRRLATGLVFGLPIAFWGIVNLWRFLYFGHLAPTSALAEGKSDGSVTVVVIGLMSVALCALIVLGVANASVSEDDSARIRVGQLRIPAIVLLVGSLLAVMGLLVWHVPQGSLGELLGEPNLWTPSPGSGLLWLLIAVTTLLTLDRWRTRASGLRTSSSLPSHCCQSSSSLCLDRHGSMLTASLLLRSRF